MTLLIVDDEAMIIKSLGIWLRRRGHTVFMASDGNSALQMLRTMDEQNMTVDIVISDFNLPDMNGLQIVDICVRNRPATRVYLMGAALSWDTVTQADVLGVTGIVHKPFQLQVVAELLSAGAPVM